MIKSVVVPNLSRRFFLALPAALLACSLSATAADREILLIAGPPSHGPLEHEQNADAMLFAKLLNQTPGIHATVSRSGWPGDPSLIEKADAIWVFCDGGGKHLIAQDGHAAQIQAAADRGAGIMFYHYGIEPPADSLHKEFLDWMGGYFEVNRSVNPIFEGDFTSLPRHPITRGVKPFKLKDEWYYNMRFRDDPKGLTQILLTVPPASSLSRPDGPHEGNPDVRSKIGQPQCVLWAYERPNGGRGVGFSGGHFHMNLEDDNLRKVTLNSLVWVAKGNVPPNGVESKVTKDDLMENLDPKGPKGKKK